MQEMILRSVLLPFDVALWVCICYCCDVFHDDFGSLSFSSAGLATNHYASVLVLLAENAISRVGYCVYMWRVLEKLSSLVFSDEFIAIDVHYPIWIDRDGDFANVSVNLPCLIPGRRKKVSRSLIYWLMVSSWFPQLNLNFNSYKLTIHQNYGQSLSLIARRSEYGAKIFHASRFNDIGSASCTMASCFHET